MDFDQFRKVMQSLNEQAQRAAAGNQPSSSGVPPPQFDLTGSSQSYNSYRRTAGSSAGNTMIVNYLSFLVFVVLMGIGFVFFGASQIFTQDTPPIGGMVAWFIGSWVIASAIKLAAQWERVLVFRLGRYVRTTGPGVYMVIPLFEQVRAIDTRVVTVDIPRQEAITKDNVPVMIDAVVFLRVVRPDQAVINVQDYMFAIVQYGRSALRDVIGGRTLDEVLTDREGIGKQIGEMLSAETEHWGMEVDGIRMQDIVLPEDLKKVMSRQAGAEREKRANITKSEGDRIAAENLAQAPGRCSLERFRPSTVWAQRLRTPWFWRYP
ncbi:MAG: slipin family protein [Armatimonadetes bacterium]|nr:slipin family protein [Armatimonadota bacterium]